MSVNLKTFGLLFCSFYLLLESATGYRIIFRGMLLHELLITIGFLASLYLLITNDIRKAIQSQDTILAFVAAGALAFFLTMVVHLSFFSTWSLTSLLSAVAICRVIIMHVHRV